MTIKQQGGIFGRNPTFNEVEASDLTVRSSVPTITIADTDTTGTHTLKASNANLDVSADPSGVQAGSGIRFFVDGDEKVKINSTGNIVISNSGNGIDFSATSGTGTSELFSDYEEGSFTPVVADAASGGNTGTASAAHGHYTKIGNQVTIHLNMTNIDTTGLTAGNDLYIQGLPYSSAAVAGTITYNGNIWGSQINLNASVPYLVPSVSENQSSILFKEWGNATGTDNLLVSEVTSGTADFNISLSYFAS